MIASDTLQNLKITISLLFEHNFLAILYLVFIIFSFIWCLWKPKRYSLLIMVGFTLLLIHFQYQKHIAPALFEQTINSVVTERPSAKIQNIVSKSIYKLFPSGLILSSITMFIFAFWFYKKENPDLMNMNKKINKM